MHSKKDNMEIMISDKVDEVVEKLFESLRNRYKNFLEKPIKGSEFVLDYVPFLYYKCYKINPNRRGSYIDSPEWIKIKKTTINHIHKKVINAFNTL